MEFHHISVMPEETVSGLVTSRDGIYVDCTLGGAGHSRLIADMLTAEGRLVGIDQDTAAIETARERLADCRCRVDIVKSNFSRLENVLAELRSDGIDINPIAVAYGGGGHKAASGATLKSKSEALSMLEDLDRLSGEER